ncbi:hypothetical protein NMG60_11015235 [Bertholletia excelsa]
MKPKRQRGFISKPLEPRRKSSETRLSISTTVLHAITANFRELVQHSTGCSLTTSTPPLTSFELNDAQASSSINQFANSTTTHDQHLQHQQQLGHGLDRSMLGGIFNYTREEREFFMNNVYLYQLIGN